MSDRLSPAAALYRAAHDLHYRENRLPEAKAQYQRVIELYPDTSEATYARTQLGHLTDVEPTAVEADPPPKVENLIEQAFRCGRCSSRECTITRAALSSGGAVSRSFDAEHNQALRVTCTVCGAIELFDYDILASHGWAAIGFIEQLYRR